ncbi:MAG: TRAP transporter large permease [Pseudomonadota bacterium]|jgi:C4-dicarboxylate transporter DctM subunit|nr:MAG: C4-dicarboxylate ABC transporter permease [Pseudomonadota bacterium]HEX5599562.1 TRAP transporter large permease [Hyphomicrobiaceae bacterium]
MFDAFQMTLLVVVLLGLVLFGTHIAVALGLTAALGVYLMMGDMEVLTSFLANTAYEAIRDYIFAVIPLFILMGEFLARCGAARDLFALVNRVMRWLPGRLGVATVVANALFAFVTGVSIAAAAAFSRIAYPEMKRHGYQRRFALATIASSACLGMLIPPSVLMIVWGVITEESIGSLFLAGVIPGLIVVAGFSIYIILVAILNPSIVGEAKARALSAAVPVVEEETGTEPSVLSALLSTGLIICLIVGVLGGIWAGFFTPTEGAGVGAAGALVIGIMKGLRLKDISEVVLTVGRTTAPLLLLLVMAQIYSRVLSMTGVTGAVQAFFLDTGLSPMAIISVMILIWFLLGCVIDSISIILLTVPVFAPIASALGFDPLAFAIIGIIAVETGLLTPPFGILVFTVKASLPHERVPVGEIFAGCIPFWIILLGTVVLLVLVPETATWLPNLGR